MLSALPTSPWSNRPRNRLPHPPLHSPGDCYVVGVVSFCFRICCFTWKNISSKFATLHLVLADRQKGDRPDNDTLSHAAFRHKKKPEPRSYRSRFSFPMNCLWMVGMQEFMPCPLCGLMSQWWGSTTCAGWLGMTSTTSERSMMSQACGAISAQIGDYCRSTWRLGGLDGIRWQNERSGFSPTDLIGQEMTWLIRSAPTMMLTLGTPGVRHIANYGGFADQLSLLGFLVNM